MTSPSRAVRLTFSLLTVANKGLLSFLSIVNIALGRPIEIVHFTQLYSLGSLLAPYLGGGTSTLILRVGFQSIATAFDLLRRLWKRALLLSLPVLALWFWVPDVALAAAFALSVVLTDSAINLLRSGQRVIQASFLIVGRLLCVLIATFAVILISPLQEAFAVFTLVGLTVAATAVTILLLVRSRVAPQEKEDPSDPPKSLPLIVMFSLNMANANVDRLLLPLVDTGAFVSTYVEVRNILTAFLFAYSAFGYYRVDQFMRREVSGRDTLLIIVVISLGLLMLFSLFGVIYGSFDPVRRHVTLSATLATWTMVSSFGALSVLSTWLMGYTTGPLLIVGPFAFLVVQLLAMAGYYFTGNASVYVYGLAVLAMTLGAGAVFLYPRMLRFSEDGRNELG